VLCGAGRPEMRRSFAMRPGLLADGTTSATSSSSSTTWATRSLGRRRVRAPAPLGYEALEVLLLAVRVDLVLDPVAGLKTFLSSGLFGEIGSGLGGAGLLEMRRTLRCVLASRPDVRSSPLRTSAKGWIGYLGALARFCSEEAKAQERGR
jgi:hypothetical protein